MFFFAGFGSPHSHLQGEVAKQEMSTQSRNQQGDEAKGRSRESLQGLYILILMYNLLYSSAFRNTAHG